MVDDICLKIFQNDTESGHRQSRERRYKRDLQKRMSEFPRSICNTDSQGVIHNKMDFSKTPALCCVLGRCSSIFPLHLFGLIVDGGLLVCS